MTLILAAQGALARAVPSLAWEVRQNHLVFWLDDPDLTDLEASPQTAHSTLLPPPPQSSAMASRRLALNLSQGLRGRAAGLAVPRRGLATPHHAPGITTQTTTLKNGLTVSPPLPRIPRAPIDQPSTSRSPRNTPPTPRPRPSACGSTPAPAQRLTRQMAPRTFSSISPSRYAPVPPPVPLRRNRPR